jgi:DNA mismatch repair protein MutS2
VLREIEALRAEMEQQAAGMTLGEEWLAQAHERIALKERAMAPPLSPVVAEDISPSPGQVGLGDTVWIDGLGTIGQVSALDGQSAEVQVGTFRVRVQVGSLRRHGRHPSVEPEPITALPGFHPSPGLELDLRGQRVEEILPRLDKYLDDAFLAGLPSVRIIHGHGTGALRRAVHAELSRHPLVKSQRAGEKGEGGEGVTIAYLG